MKLTLTLIGTIMASAASTSLAHAAEPTQADALFREGRALLDAKRYDEACPKLAESQRLEPGAGTLLALAMCHEGQGKTATASTELKHASELGRRVGRNDLASAADRRARALEASIPHLLVHLPSNAEGYRVRCDGEALTSEAEAPHAMDPGEHKVEVAADGKMTRSYVVRITGAGTTEIVVERLEDVPTAKAPAASPPAPKPIIVEVPVSRPSPPPESDNGGAQRTTGVVLIGAGIIGLGVGAYFGGRALSESSQAKKICPSSAGCEDGEAQALNDNAKSSFKASVVSLAAGTGAITIGAIVYFLAPKASSARTSSTPPKRTARVIPSAGPSNVGLGVVGTF